LKKGLAPSANLFWSSFAGYGEVPVPFFNTLKASAVNPDSHPARGQNHSGRIIATQR
jgi:hypothetical protein